MDSLGAADSLGATDGLGATDSVTSILSSAGPKMPGVVLVKVSTELELVATKEYSCAAHFMSPRLFPAMLVSKV